MSDLWLYLHFPSLQLDCLHSKPGQPVVVLNKADNRIIQLNQTAYQCGIRPGMGLGTAASLCHGLQVAEYQQQLESDKLKDIACWLYGCTSDIALWPPDGLLLRVHPMLSLYGGLQPYWLAVKQRLQPLAFSHTYASGQTPLAARLLARQGLKLIDEEPQKLHEAIRHCPLSATDLSTKQQHQLTRVGVRHVGELLAISPTELSQRFSHDLAIYTGRLSGHFSHPQIFYYPPPHFRQTLTLLYGVENSQRLLSPIQALLLQLEHFLRLRDKLTTRLLLRFVHQDNSTAELCIESAQAEYQVSFWQSLIVLKLEKLTLCEAVHAITLKVTELQDKPGQCQDLFAGQQGRQTPLQLLAQLQAKLGKEALKGLGLGDDFRPEQSTGYTEPDFTGISCINRTLPSMRPLLLCDPPIALNEKVRLLHGPERIETGWWDSKPVHRDYFIGRCTKGRWLWVYRTPQAQWLIQGVFS